MLSDLKRGLRYLVFIDKQDWIPCPVSIDKAISLKEQFGRRAVVYKVGKCDLRKEKDND
jgi:hypothetical protein